MAVVELENISKSYGKDEAVTTALSNVSLSIEKNEFVAITGPSGSGKTTLANIIGLLDDSETGSHHFNQVDINKARHAERTRLRREHIGWIFENFNFVPGMSAANNVELAMMYDGVKPKDRKFKARRLLKQVGLADKAKAGINTLSGEQKQRVGIARSLANKPSLIIADEPTGNLNGKAAATIMKMLSKLHGRGFTLLVMTHDPEVAKHANRNIQLNNSQLQPSSKPESGKVKAL